MNSRDMAWAALAAAGLLDVGWALSMKLADGYTRLGWSLASIASLVAFVLLLGRALQALPLGVAYAVWTGIGAVGTMLASTLVFGEGWTIPRVVGVGLVVVGIVVLRLTGR